MEAAIYLLRGGGIIGLPDDGLDGLKGVLERAKNLSKDFPGITIYRVFRVIRPSGAVEYKLRRCAEQKSF